MMQTNVLLLFASWWLLVFQLPTIVVASSSSVSSKVCDSKVREKYCSSSNPNHVQLCLNCHVGPRCPVPGNRTTLLDDQGTLLLRGVPDGKARRLVLSMLNKKRSEEEEDWTSSCVPIFTWDTDLAQAAQAWADQCALVEYNDPTVVLHHDSWKTRTTAISGQRFADQPGVAQTVHWARTDKSDLVPSTIEALVNSDLQIEEGLIDGLFTDFTTDNKDAAEETMMAWGHATHVGCGWIQFPQGEQHHYDNFMVCNYGIGVAAKTSCSKEKEGEEEAYITYYTAPSEVILDVKACLAAVRCRRRKRRLLKALQSPSEDDPCGEDVAQCLAGKSGLKFMKPSQLKSVARSGDPNPIDVEAAKCKIDTILCSINASQVCGKRMRKCLPLLDLINDSAATAAAVECKCAQLVLADGTRGDCTEALPDDPEGNRFCHVQESPCLSVGTEGQIEISRPHDKLNGLVHIAFTPCKRKPII